MLSYDDAIRQILEKVTPRSPVERPLLDTCGLVLAEDVVAPLPIPPFANSAMDGYAVRAQDVQDARDDKSVRLPVTQDIAAGSTPTAPLSPQTAARIMTGAPLPDGADAVVPVEETETEGDNVVIKAAAVQPFIRAAGGDVSAGTIVVSADTPIRAAEIGMFAAVGRRAVRVYPRPRVAIISTGDELVEPGRTLGPGRIYNSNAYSLAAQVMEAGGIVVQRLLTADTAAALRTAFDACAGVDVLITSGGVSVGDYDYVKSVFAERGSVDFWRVAIRPGKPLAFGSWGDTLFFGLPGNPVSSMVTFELFVRPTLRKMLGLSELSRPLVQAQLTQEAGHEPGRRDYLRAFVTREGDAYLAHTVGAQGSHRLSSMVQANGLLIIPEHISTVPAGEFATVMLLD